MTSIVTFTQQLQKKNKKKKQKDKDLINKPHPGHILQHKFSQSFVTVGSSLTGQSYV